MEAIEQYFPVVLFIMLYKVVPTFVSVDEDYYIRTKMVLHSNVSVCE